MPRKRNHDMTNEQVPQEPKKMGRPKSVARYHLGVRVKAPYVRTGKHPYVGKPPKDRPCVLTIAGEWHLYECPESPNGEYRNYKLVSIHPRLTKANFWIGFNRKEKRIVMNTDARTMVNQYYDLFLAVTDALKQDECFECGCVVCAETCPRVERVLKDLVHQNR